MRPDIENALEARVMARHNLISSFVRQTEKSLEACFEKLGETPLALTRSENGFYIENTPKNRNKVFWHIFPEFNAVGGVCHYVIRVRKPATKPSPGKQDAVSNEEWVGIYRADPSKPLDYKDVVDRIATLICDNIKPETLAAFAHRHGNDYLSTVLANKSKPGVKPA